LAAQGAIFFLKNVSAKSDGFEAMEWPSPRASTQFSSITGTGN